MRTLAGTDATERFLLEQPQVSEVRQDKGGFVFDFEGSNEEAAGLLKRLVDSGLTPVEFAPEVADLEDIFLTLTEGRVQ